MLITNENCVNIMCV